VSVAEYAFEHGISDCGHDGIAPVLVIGGAVQERDFAARDLSAIRGVIVEQNGQRRGTRWRDLNLRLLFKKLAPIEYLNIRFDGAVDLSDIGIQPKLRRLYVQCPNAKVGQGDAFPAVEVAQVRWPTACTERLLGSSVRDLHLIRPSMSDIGPLGKLKGLESLRIGLTSRLESLRGIGALPKLSKLVVFDCQQLVDIGVNTPCRNPEFLTINNCRNLIDLTAVRHLQRLRRLELLDCAAEVKLPASLQTKGIALHMSPFRVQWVEGL
jgi:hypothetical protein